MVHPYITLGTMVESLSVAMALDALVEQCHLVEERQAALEEARSERDRLISIAVTRGYPYRPLSRLTGLSRHRLWTIANQAAEDERIDQ